MKLEIQIAVAELLKYMQGVAMQVCWSCDFFKFPEKVIIAGTGDLDHTYIPDCGGRAVWKSSQVGLAVNPFSLGLQASLPKQVRLL